MTVHTRKAVFLDRDGTLNSDEGHYYIYKPEDFVFNPGVIEGLKRLQKAGFLLFVVTNQGGIAKGIYTHEDVKRVHDYMCSILANHGVSIDKIYYCPHHESVESCICRKPSPYMINQAIEEFGIDKNQAWMIGDGKRDVEAAEAAGIKAILIQKNQNLIPAIEQILDSNRQ
ncbi:D-glycero-alpha-D-manno-heptose-1,7-bisphosphate 7-phosphatase [Odoribacter lunatus]|uniref:D-glycero-alpha-D-manno-heptose-1,7-bisphosphate 7-phosphatase n=1 Tax=Odoribacter lunatus TaxID=2941335 RepID=UPI00203CD1A1|nr:HAD family hydrolase [Odoribacter lunatus]